MSQQECETIALVGVENCTYSFDRLFRFIVPENFSELLRAGMRVLVPFGRGNTLRQGFVFSISKDSACSDEKTELKHIASVIDGEPLLSEELLVLAQWIRDCTFSTYFVSARAMLPGGMCLKTEKIYSVVSDIAPEKYEKLSVEEKNIVVFLSGKKTPQREKTVYKRLGFAENDPILKRLVAKGILNESSDVFGGTGDLSFQAVRIKEGFNVEGEDVGLTVKQHTVIETLQECGEMTVKELCYYAGCSDSVVKGLIKKGILNESRIEVMRSPEISFEASDGESGGGGLAKRPTLSPAQNSAFEKLYLAYRSDKSQTALLFGVTGSGKTGVYLQLIDRVIEDGKSVIVLVPEISLTPQAFSLFRVRYGKKIAVLHSGLSVGERYDEWKRIKRGEAAVVIGTRSAVFAPVENLGLIVIDEEQEHTYKSEMSPRYNAKEVAKFRCGFNNALLVLASATPSIETYAKAESGQYILCELPERFGRAVLPKVQTVDMTNKSLLDSFFAVSNPLAKELEKNLSSGEQSILLINRRGFNTFVVCSDCKKVITCPKCSISMTYHSANNRLMCHYCGHSVEYTEKCPTCGAENIRYSGFGTQRVEKELQLRFPSARILRMDADTVTGRDSHSRSLSAFSKGEYDILIGTQMVAKGLDFPNVTLVGVASADKELYNNDFRSSERTFDLITQVVGRAGRGEKGGRAVIQTLVPENAIIEVASRQDYLSFYKGEMILRRSMIYPPFCDICMINFSSENEENSQECADAFFARAVELNENEFSDQKIIILGPMYPRVSKINGRYRRKIIIKCKNSARFRLFVNRILTDICSDRTSKNVSIFADMNPETTD